MNLSTAEALFASPWQRAKRFGAAAFAGITPGVAALVAALLLIRMVSATLDKVVVAAHHDDLAGWLIYVLRGYAGLLIMAAPMLVGIVAASNLGPQRGLRRVAALAAAVVVSAGLGVLLRATASEHFGLGAGWARISIYLEYVWPRYAALGGMLTVVAEFYRREAASTRALQRAETDRAAFEREVAEARLQVMQAQVEPHFLFNTLANVRQLYEKDRAAGRRMLESLMRYLEVALPRMRESETTLAREASLVEDFLHLHQVRMARRLAYAIDIPTGLRNHPMPPMMLLTLAENAIKHGLNPAPDGGRIRISARAEGDRLVVRVADTGVGFASASGTGTGLANIRARLAAQLGDEAGLVLENNELGGATATLTLPLVARGSGR
jgi:signal transduction histidine kinase